MSSAPNNKAPLLGLKVKKSSKEDGLLGVQRERSPSFRRMTPEEESFQTEKIDQRHQNRGFAFYGTDVSVAHSGPINPLGFLPTPPNSTSGCCQGGDEKITEHHIFKAFPKRLAVAYAETQGRRSAMEDQMLISHISVRSGIDVVGVFDGHAGTDASRFCADHMGTVLQDQIIEKETHLSTLKRKEFENELTQLLKETFVVCHQKMKEQGIDGGTTALLVVQDKELIWIANAGDCRAIISTKQTAQRITVDHKPGNPIERKRIETVGGHITVQQTSQGKDLCRVNGLLSVSRAIGDFELEPYITPEPDIFHLKLSELEGEFIVIACDGLWDEVSDEECIKTVKGHLKVQAGDWEGAVRRLRDLSYASGSKDNISVVIVHTDSNGNQRKTGKIESEPLTAVRVKSTKGKRSASMAPKPTFQIQSDPNPISTSDLQNSRHARKKKKKKSTDNSPELPLITESPPEHRRRKTKGQLDDTEAEITLL